MRRGAHVRVTFEFAGIGCPDAKQTRTELNRRQGAGVYLLVNLFAPDQPVLRKFRYRYVRLRMRLEIHQAHVASCCKEFLRFLQDQSEKAGRSRIEGRLMADCITAVS
jgi:hypothetical protein